MKLTSIQLCNFRQFYGKTPEIQFAGSDRNITIIHGNNGSGKTTLLNAFTWALYEKFSAAFASPEQLVNKRAINEVEPREPVDCFVEVAFEREHQRYRLKRLCRAYRSDIGEVEYGKTEVWMWVAGDDGRWTPTHQHPDDIIGRILPGSLHQYFFFDGERIEHIVRDDKKAEIAEATKELLGVEVFNRSLRHLKEAVKTLEDELQVIGNPQTQKVLAEKQKLEQQREQLIQRQNEIQQELAHHGEIKQAVQTELLQMGGVEDLQTRRDRLESQKANLRQQLQSAKDLLKRTLSTKAYTFLLGDTTAKCQDILEGMRQRGELPTGIKKTFVEDLLNQKRCICGAELTDGSHAYHLVQAWREKAGIADIEETAIRLTAQTDELKRQASEFWEITDREQANLTQWRTELSQIETELDDIRNKLISYPDIDIQQLQKRLDSLDSKINELQRETGANQQKLEMLDSDIEKAIKQVAKQQMNEERQALAQRRIQATQEAIERIGEVKNRLEKQFRSSLEKRVQEIFSQISFTPYLPKLSEKYELSLVEKTSLFELPVAASTGENQILCLSFIGGIIDRVREWSQSRLHLGPNSSTFPVVMDSPFGSLDEIYRRQVAKSLPQLANQLIVLVTKTQWRGEVETEMNPRIGKEYLLVYHSPKPNCEEDWLERQGERYALVKRSTHEFEYTEIVEIPVHL